MSHIVPVLAALTALLIQTDSSIDPATKARLIDMALALAIGWGLYALLSDWLE